MKTQRWQNVTVTYDDTSSTAHVTGSHPKAFCVAFMKGRASLATKKYPGGQNHDDYVKLDSSPKEHEVTIAVYEAVN